MIAAAKNIPYIDLMRESCECVARQRQEKERREDERKEEEGRVDCGNCFRASRQFHWLPHRC